MQDDANETARRLLHRLQRLRHIDPIQLERHDLVHQEREREGQYDGEHEAERSYLFSEVDEVHDNLIDDKTVQQYAEPEARQHTDESQDHIFAEHVV